MGHARERCAAADTPGLVSASHQSASLLTGHCWEKPNRVCCCCCHCYGTAASVVPIWPPPRLIPSSTTLELPACFDRAKAADASDEQVSQLVPALDVLPPMCSCKYAGMSLHHAQTSLMAVRDKAVAELTAKFVHAEFRDAMRFETGPTLLHTCQVMAP